MHYRDAPLMDVLNDLARQTRANFNDPSPEFGGVQQLPRITVDVDRVSFWTAIRKIQDEGKVAFFPQGDGWHVTRGNIGMPSVRGEEAGAFLVQPMSASYQRSVAYQNMGASGEYFSLQFQVIAEPKIRLDAAPGRLKIDRAVDSNGNDLMGPQTAQQIQVGGGQNSINCNINLRFPKASPGEKIAEISGTMSVFMARRIQSLTSDNLMAEQAPMRLQVDGSTVTLDVANRPGAPRPTATVPNEESLPGAITLVASVHSC